MIESEIVKLYYFIIYDLRFLTIVTEAIIVYQSVGQVRL